VIALYSTQFQAIEAQAAFISTLLTLVGVLITVLSIYIPTPSMRPPFVHSKKTVGPIVIAVVFMSFCVLLVRRQLPMVWVSGVGLLGIAGGLKRMLPYPQDPDTLAEEQARSASARN
jgi:hypothetical protein